MLTAIDQIANRNHLQMVKAAVPYLPTKEQRFISCYIKLMELQNVMKFFSGGSGQLQCCASDQEASSPADILNDIRNYCDESEQKWIDQMSNIMTAMELFSIMSEKGDQEEDYE